MVIPASGEGAQKGTQSQLCWSVCVAQDLKFGIWVFIRVIVEDRSDAYCVSSVYYLSEVPHSNFIGAITLYSQAP